MSGDRPAQGAWPRLPYDRGMRGKWILVAGTAVLAAVAAGALSFLRQETPANESAAASQSPGAPSSNEVSLSGKIQAQHVATVRAQVNGEIESFLVDTGEQVYEGQLLARISNTALESALQLATEAVQRAQERVQKADSAIIAARLEASRARADATRARSEYDRTERLARRQEMLHREGATPRLAWEKSQREFETAQTEYRSLDELARQAEERVSQLIAEQQAARSQLEEKRADLEEASGDVQAAEVHAPVSGLVVARKGEVGERLGGDEESKVLFQIAGDLSALEVVLEPEPAVLQRISPGMPALVFVADLQEGLAGVVAEVRENQAIVEFKSPNPVVKPGMTAQVRINLN